MPVIAPAKAMCPGFVREIIRVLSNSITFRDQAVANNADSLVRPYEEQLRREFELGRILRLIVITVELILIAVAIRLANIESPAFESVLMLAIGGFLVHHFLPEAWRLGFFAILSAISIPLVFEWHAGLWLLVIGGLLIAVCHLPVPFWMRVAAIVVFGLALALVRERILPQFAAVPGIVWPILGSMFMFRMAIYLYDLKNAAAPFSISRAFSYFFMLPNVCFPLFPVVDYKTLQRSIYNDDPLRLYQKGVRWMLRGLVQLALYKAVYFLAAIEPSAAVNGTDAARYMVATFLLYLKISGLFHLIVGLLHLYGFGLAETHHFYLFSSSFTDFWRRINIYWKDFIQKLIFNPIYFLLRSRGETFAIVLATLIAFTATWLLHSYQWFWIRGEFPIVWADVVFWLGLGVIVLFNVLLESRKGRRRTLTAPARTWRNDMLLAAKISGTFAAICILWTIWSTPDLAELGFIWRAVLNSGPVDLAVLLGIPIGLGILGAALQHRRREVAGSNAAGDTNRSFLLQSGVICLTASAMIAVGVQPNLLKPVSPVLVSLVTDMRERNQLNERDSKAMVRGYYEDLGDAARFNSELGMMFGMQPPDWKGAVPFRETPDAIQKQYVPSTATFATGTVRTINSLGLRDREYSLVPEPGTFRIGLIGASHDMGWGVKDHETYENLVEDYLNQDLGRLTGNKFEILNFSFPSYLPTQKLAVIEQRMLQTRPDLILYVASTLEIDWMFRSVPILVKNGILDQFPFIQDALNRAGIKPEALPEKAVLEQKLAPFAEEALSAVFERFRNETSAKGVRSALVLLEIPDDGRSRDRKFDQLVRLGQAARLPVLDLQGSFAHIRNRQSLWVAPWDHHTNAEGHRLLARRLYTLLRERELIPTLPSPDQQSRQEFK